jgi:predicted phage terminase large subunit-like protein
MLTAEQLERLTPQERAEYDRLATYKLSGETLREFLARVSPHHPPPRHFDPIIEQLELAMLAPGTVNVAFSMPPRHGKTVLIQHAIAWWLSRRPADTCAYASYSEKQAHSKSRKTRDLALKGGVVIRSDSSNLAEWRTRNGGGLLSGGAGSGLTGQGVSGLMVVDDPFKSMKEAQSQARRDEVGEWFDAVVQTRNEGASTIVIHTRWHEDDLIGRLKKDPDWVIINIPALAEENDPLGREVGAPLWPERGGRFSKEGLEKRRSKNLFVFLALYQGRPRPKGGKVFVGPAHYYDPATLDVEGMTIVSAADPAATANTSSDFCVAISAWVSGFNTEDCKIYIREVFREQLEVPEFASQLVAFQYRHGGAPINVEAVGAFKAIPQLMRMIRPDIQLRECPTHGDKFARAQPAGGAWKEGRILVPYDAPWLQAFLEELALFTGVGDKHDDQVDALSHLYNNADAATIFDV